MESSDTALRLIHGDLSSFEQQLHDVLCSSDGYVDSIFGLIKQSHGKRLRPILVYLSCRMFSEVTAATHRAALLVELMHTATLLHDDVVDNACIRRGNPTVNRRFDTKTAVLAGDLLFAKAMHITTLHHEYPLFDIITPAIIAMSEGELQEIDMSVQRNFSEEKYFTVIRNKTAMLLSACCKAGAFTAGAPPNSVDILARLGLVFGIIFQLKDDILDYAGNEKFGKEIGIDARERKITLPLIRSVANMDATSRSTFMKLWNTPSSGGHEQQIINFVKTFNGIDESLAEINAQKQVAEGILRQLPASPAKSCMAAILDWIIERDK